MKAMPLLTIYASKDLFLTLHECRSLKFTCLGIKAELSGFLPTLSFLFWMLIPTMQFYLQQLSQFGSRWNKNWFQLYTSIGPKTRVKYRVELFFQSGDRNVAKFLACNHMTRRPCSCMVCWWSIQQNSVFSRRIYMKIGFSSQRKEILLFLTLTQHTTTPDVTCKPAICFPIRIW